MKIKRMGRTGLRVSEICLDTMTFGYQCDQPTSFAILDYAWQAGVNFIDTADVYPLPPDPKPPGPRRRLSATGSRRILDGGMKRSWLPSATSK